MYNLLLVDDEPEVLESLHDILTNNFNKAFNITTTSYSAEAIKVIKNGITDILVTDIKMPEYTGFDLANEIRRINSAAKVIFLTGFANFDYAYSAIKSGCDDYILKINAEKEIVASIYKLLDFIDIDYNGMLAHGERKIDEEDTMEHIKKYICEHISEDLSLQKLSDAMYYNPSYLSRIFRQQTGESLSNFIINERINEAKKLLQETRLKIYEVSQQVGIESPIYFNRIFKKKTGVSPKVYRQKKIHKIYRKSL